MAAVLLTCAFAGFCGLAGCGGQPGDHVVRARLDPDRPMAEFWTSGPPGIEPWPAILQSTGFSRDEWVLFTAGPLHGHWMLTVVPATGEALLSHHYIAFGPDARSARGTCTLLEETL
jgi:hypothetical protein